MSDYIVNGNKIRLTQKQYLTSGGEGDIYLKDGIIYKICQPGKSIDKKKIDELGQITNKQVITPQNLILNPKGENVGYTLQYVKNTFPVIQLFPKAFKTQNNIQPKQILELIDQLKNIIHKDIHIHNILLVDINENNFLVSQKLDSIYCIDTNSYQTPNFPATAIMESIKDYTSNKFTKESDWFSFGILSFQMLIGIHPFRGKHPQYQGWKDRIVNRKSIFSSEVSYPKSACWDISIIPETYKKWYYQLFEEGKRLPPPNVFQVVQIHIVKSTKNNLKIELLGEVDDKIIYLDYEKIITRKTIYNNRFQKIENYETPQKNFWVSGKEYQHNGENIVQLGKIGNIKTQVVVGNVLENVVKIYENVLHQEIFFTHLVSFFNSNCIISKLIKTLDHKRIIFCKYDKQILGVCVQNSTNYTTHIFRLNSSFDIEDSIVFDNLDVPDILNFSVLNNGIVCYLYGDTLTVFHKQHLQQTKVVAGNSIQDMKLWTDGNYLLGEENNKLYKIQMQ